MSSLDAPLTSYGTQKSICELLLSDYTRRGFLDGIGIRLPTICVRPGLPNKAASGFFSNIIREPLAGKPAILPVSEAVRHWHASPRSAIGFLMHAATLESRTDRTAAQFQHAGPVGDGRRADRRPDERLPALPSSHASSASRTARSPASSAAGRRISTRSARSALGFTAAEKTFEDIIRIHIEDELRRNVRALALGTVSHGT